MCHWRYYWPGYAVSTLGGSAAYTTFTPIFSGTNFGSFSTNGPGESIDLGADPLDHARTLARFAEPVHHFSASNPPLQGLIRLLLVARSFVHITTFGLDSHMLGILETVSQRVPVYVLASGLNPNAVPGLAEAETEAPQLNIRVGGTKAEPGDQNHGKLIVVDGLVAISGSVNLTSAGWRKAANDMEIIDVDTDGDKVRRLNNRHFSPLWVQHAASEQGAISTLGGWNVSPPDA